MKIKDCQVFLLTFLHHNNINDPQEAPRTEEVWESDLGPTQLPNCIIKLYSVSCRQDKNTELGLPSHSKGSPLRILLDIVSSRRNNMISWAFIDSVKNKIPPLHFWIIIFFFKGTCLLEVVGAFAGYINFFLCVSCAKSLLVIYCSTKAKRSRITSFQDSRVVLRILQSSSVLLHPVLVLSGRGRPASNSWWSQHHHPLHCTVPWRACSSLPQAKPPFQPSFSSRVCAMMPSTL